MNKYTQYLAQTTQPHAVPSQPQPTSESDTPDVPVIKASRYLGTRRMYLPNGTFIIREKWSSAKFRVIGYYTKLEDGYGVYVVNSDHVRIADKEAVVTGVRKTA